MGQLTIVVREARRPDRPIAGVVVDLWESDAPPQRFTVDSAGVLRLPELAPATYRLRLSQLGWDRPTTTVRVAAGCPVVLEAYLQRLVMGISAVIVSGPNKGKTIEPGAGEPPTRLVTTTCRGS
ncbi:MAG: hypothetical protein MUF00_19455 [Gemmatimonadaceae bacterium]|nr:hypothetical protein [Gemmatimonadaceae bacterium]